MADISGDVRHFRLHLAHEHAVTVATNDVKCLVAVDEGALIGRAEGIEIRVPEELQLLCGFIERDSGGRDGLVEHRRAHLVQLVEQSVVTLKFSQLSKPLRLRDRHWVPRLGSLFDGAHTGIYTLPGKALAIRL